MYFEKLGDSYIFSYEPFNLAYAFSINDTYEHVPFPDFANNGCPSLLQGILSSIIT